MELLLAGVSAPKEAKQLSLSRTTVWRWQRDPVFVAEMQSRRDERKAAVQATLVDVALEAVDVLRSVMLDKAIRPSVRVRAAEAILARAGLEPAPVAAASSSVSVLLGNLREVEKLKPIEASYWEDGGG